MDTVAEAKSSRKLVVVSILAYFVFLLVMFPLNIAYKLIDPKGLPVQVVSVSGTLWDGQLVIKQSLIGQTQLDWTLSPMALLTGEVNSQFSVKSAQFEGKGNVSLAMNGDITLNQVSAYVDAALINKPLRSQKVNVNGDLELIQTNIVFNMKEKITSFASGRLVWAGGDVQYPKGRSKKSANLPMLIADISSLNGELLAQVHTDDGLNVAKGNLKADGWASIAIQKRMIDLVGEPWPNKASADSVIFEVSEKVF